LRNDTADQTGRTLMLSRTAQNLFWMGRYIERADATARLIEMGRRMTMLPGSRETEEWRSVARASGSAVDLAEAGVKASEIITRLLVDPDNPSSIRSCLVQARANGKAIRTALTQDMWEALNDGWRTFEGAGRHSLDGDLAKILDWTRGRAAAFRGAVETSLLRNDGYGFLKLGEFLERADMTLRLLDVKYYVLLPETEVVGGGRDYHQWTSVLHATSALRAYHHVNRDDYTPWGIADFLILNPSFPRSVRFCFSTMSRTLDELEGEYLNRHDCHVTAAAMAARLSNCTIQSIFQSGLHEFVYQAIETTNALHRQISKAYHF
jgi:uncharacterized alpha-E superfamily protein